MTSFPDTASTPEPCPPIAPLHYPEGGVPEASRLERALFWIPILGWIIASAIGNRRIHPTLMSIDSQLRQRPNIPTSVWGDSEERQKFGALLAATIEEEEGLREHSIIPDDPLELLFFYTDLDFLFVLSALEKKLGLLDWSLISSLPKMPDIAPLTLGQFLTVLMDRIDQVRERQRDLAKRSGTPAE